MQRRRVLGVGVLTLALALGGCARLASRTDGAEAADEGAVRIRFEDREAPGAFSMQGMAVRDRTDGAAGLWAAAGGLKRPERALVENLGNGRTVVVALYSGGRGGAVTLSAQAAERLAVGDRPARVRVTALRQTPQLDATSGRF